MFDCIVSGVAGAFTRLVEVNDKVLGIISADLPDFTIGYAHAEPFPDVPDVHIFTTRADYENYPIRSAACLIAPGPFQGSFLAIPPQSVQLASILEEVVKARGLVVHRGRDHWLMVSSLAPSQPVVQRVIRVRAELLPHVQFGAVGWRTNYDLLRAAIRLQETAQLLIAVETATPGIKIQFNETDPRVGIWVEDDTQIISTSIKAVKRAWRPGRPLDLRRVDRYAT